MANVKDKVQKVFEFIQSYLDDNGYPPSVREICKELQIKSTASCYSYLSVLEKEGKIVKDGSKKRAINVNTPKKVGFVSVPVIGTVAAGSPIFAYEDFDEYIPLPKEFGEESELFMLKINGNSMIECGIFDGDKVIVKKQNNAENGDIVVAMYEDSATVKRFFKREDKIVLHPENSTMADIILPDVNILGKVVGLMRKM